MKPCAQCGGMVANGVCTKCSAMAPAETDWKFGWSPLYGIHYGPIPIGIIIVVLGAIGYYASR